MKARFILTFSLAIILFAPSHNSLHAQVWANSTYTYDVTDHPYGYKRHECGGTLLNIDGDPVGVIIGGRGSDRKTIHFYLNQNRVDVSNQKAPYELHHMQAVVINDTVAICGMGFTGGFPNEVPSPNILAYDFKSDTYTTIGTIPAARQRGGAASAVDGDWIYYFSGLTDGHKGGWVPYTDRYNYVTDTWETLPDAPRSRDHSYAVKEGGKVYLVGGRRSDSDGPNGLHSFMVDEIDVFNLTTLSWEASPISLPESRAGALVTSRYNLSGELEIYAWGGESKLGVLSSGDMLNMNSLSTTTLPALADPRHASVIFPDPASNKIYTLAGAYYQGWENEIGWASYVQEYEFPGVLPVSWKHVHAENLEGGIHIDWEVSELAVKQYQVQRKAAGESWKVINTQIAKGDGEQQYSYLDKSAMSEGTMNYRIVSTDYDGSKSYSRILELKSRSIPLNVYPNPLSSSQGIIYLSRPVKRMELIDFKGAVLSRAFESDQLKINSDLASGLYIFRAYDAEGLIYADKFLVE